MNRRRFFKALGILSAAVVVAPVALVEMKFAEEPDAYSGPWMTLQPTDQLDTKTFRRAVEKLKAARDPYWRDAKEYGIEVMTGG